MRKVKAIKEKMGFTQVLVRRYIIVGHIRTKPILCRKVIHNKKKGFRYCIVYENSCTEEAMSAEGIRKPKRTAMERTEQIKSVFIFLLLLKKAVEYINAHRILISHGSKIYSPITPAISIITTGFRAVVITTTPPTIIPIRPI